MQRRQLLSRSLGAAAALPVGLTLATPSAAVAAPAQGPARTLVVEAVQMPVWVRRGEQRQPLHVGDAVSTAQEVETAAGSALVLRLPEGSLIRLGEKTRLGVARFEATGTAGEVSVTSDLKLFDGFFRFATSTISRVVGQRQIKVAVRTATIGVRGTDFWTMTDAEHDATCLFEGQVKLDTQDQGELALDKPTAFWARFFDKPVQPVGNATPDQLNKFLNSTELTPGRGVAVVGGAWTVQALTTPDSRRALQVAGRLRALGYPARLQAKTTPKGEQHEVLIQQLATEADARAVLERIKDTEGVSAKVVAAH